MKERDLLRDVIDTARMFGWRAFHVPMPVRPIGGGKTVPESRARGLPDLILLHDDPPRLIFAELKGDSGHPLSDEQAEFLRLVNEVGDATVGAVRSVRGYVWTSLDVQAYTEILRSRVLS